ncbi:type B chloramphenicol O-acetyltransferase [Ferrimonas balearica]|uniref:type B chloramphenicol O-acetyltransferase n=1 Tax=Ferrimonas balearica TaxID=44012 RepID=UPI001C9592D1|nr:type B chloramphenicol O-acetyltransferase [Ferrimonas balearica]MBY5980885.1 type B chloramphenicol O-acetyltransferase [Ferrimonas balearica]
MNNYFESPFAGKPLAEQVSNPNIDVGAHSYYSGYYHGHPFEHCVRYLVPDRTDVDRLIIGRYCSIGTGAVFVMAGNQGHRMDWITTFPFFYQDNPAFADANDAWQPAGDTVLGNDVWVGSEAMILPGVKVGHGAVIAARAVVTKNVPPYAIVAGNPARLIRHRFDDAAQAKLLEMAWWDWPEAQLAAAMSLLCSGDIDGLYQHWLAQGEKSQK